MTLDPKDPNGSNIDYHIDWTSWLLDNGGGAIVSSVWILPSGITKDAETFTNTKSTIWLSGGTAGNYYPLINRITTSATPPRTQDGTITIRVKEL